MITINGKTYKQLHNKYSIDWLVKHGYLEEVKENKEMNRTEKHSFFQKKIHEGLLQEAGLEEKPLSQKRAEAIERGKEITILEKLRELQRIHNSRPYDRMFTYDFVEKIFTDLLTSLETPQFTPGQEEPETVSDKNMIRINKYDFTPGQEIEVSNDGERWYKKEFTHTGRGIALADKTIYFYTTGLDPEYNDGRKLGEGWKFARPIEDKIEPELPEFSYDRCDEENNLVEQVHEIGVQVEALTTFCQALARQKTTK